MKLEIGKAVHLKVIWYDKVPEPAKAIEYDGEVVGWKNSQVIVRVRDYAVVRFWKRSGLEVGNPDHQRRGFSVDLSQLDNNSNSQGLDIPIAIDTDA